LSLEIVVSGLRGGGSLFCAYVMSDVSFLAIQIRDLDRLIAITFEWPNL